MLLTSWSRGMTLRRTVSPDEAWKPSTIAWMPDFGTASARPEPSEVALLPALAGGLPPLHAARVGIAPGAAGRLVPGAPRRVAAAARGQDRYRAECGGALDDRTT